MGMSSAISVLFLFSIILVVNAVTVLDIDGDELETNRDYYILPVNRGMGGGLGLAQRNNTCPFYVAQDDGELSDGLPLKFLPTDAKQKFVEESTDMNFVFSASTTCVQSTVWEAGPVGEGSYITTGGKVGNPGFETLSSWFKIERYDKNYRLVFCPVVCDFCRPACGEVAVSVENGKRWLVISRTLTPFPVMFKKA